MRRVHQPSQAIPPAQPDSRCCRVASSSGLTPYWPTWRGLPSGPQGRSDSRKHQRLTVVFKRIRRPSQELRADRFEPDLIEAWANKPPSLCCRFGRPPATISLNSKGGFSTQTDMH